MMQAEKLIKVIINDLLKYLRLKEQDFVAENRLTRQIPHGQREKKKIRKAVINYNLFLRLPPGLILQMEILWKSRFVSNSVISLPFGSNMCRLMLFYTNQPNYFL